MIFLTVGTQFPFDRLVKAVDELASQNGFDEEIFGQVGTTSYQPMSFQAVASLEKTQFDKYLREAKAIISHAGMGTILMAIDYEKPLLVLPRLRKYGEAVNNHQVEIARRFEQLGHLLAAYTVEELPDKIKQLSTFHPKPRASQAHLVAQRIAQFLEELSAS
jgi:UDP-N-acetylglucosamine transferase subunit ALG13